MRAVAADFVVEVLDEGLEIVDLDTDLEVKVFELAVFLRVVAFLERRDSSPSIDLFLSIVYNYNIMTVKLTKKQLAVLEFIQEFTEERGFSPSYREIMTGLGLSSVSAVAEHVDNLVMRGALKKVPGAARSLEILDYKHEETVELFRERIMTASEEDKKVLMRAAEILGLDFSLDADFGGDT